MAAATGYPKPHNGGIVIVGGGPAAWRCGFALREFGVRAPITMICDESTAPYDRTLVSKDCLDRDPSAAELLLSDHASYRDAGIDVRIGNAATSIGINHRRVYLSDGQELPYAWLVVATGGTPRTSPSLSAPGVHTLRTLDDARRLRRTLRSGQRVAIVGGGFIAGEAASAARWRGASVVMLESLDAPLAHVLGPEVAQNVADLHIRAGVEVRVRSTVHSVKQRQSRYELHLGAQGRIEADTVLVAIGSRPAVGWLRLASGLAIDDGIVTDEHCRTTAPGVLAVGDCARWRNQRTGLLTRVEHWSTAIEHGAAAAATIAGARKAFNPVPFVWSIQHGARLQWVGEGSGWDRFKVVDGPPNLVVRYSRGGEFCAGFAIDNPRAIAAMRRELQHQLISGTGENPRR